MAARYIPKGHTSTQRINNKPTKSLYLTHDDKDRKNRKFENLNESIKKVTTAAKLVTKRENTKKTSQNLPFSISRRTISERSEPQKEMS